MTPSNHDNNQPLIYRIADALGVFHLVAPVNHTHAQSEVEGLESALAAKANAIPAGSPTGAIVIANTAGEISRSGKTITDLLSAIAAKADKNELGDSESGTFVLIDNDILRLSAYQKMVLGISEPDDEFVEISNDNIQNLRRALANPDSTPKSNSDNLVTSGGVKAALDGKAPAGDTEVIFEEGENIFVYLPNYFTNGERQRSFILNYQGEAAELIDLFGGNTNDSIRILSHDDSIIAVTECYIAVRVIKQSGVGAQGDTYYIIFDGKNEY